MTWGDRETASRTTDPAPAERISHHRLGESVGLYIGSRALSGSTSGAATDNLAEAAGPCAKAPALAGVEWCCSAMPECPFSQAFGCRPLP